MYRPRIAAIRGTLQLSATAEETEKSKKNSNTENHIQ